MVWVTELLLFDSRQSKYKDSFFNTLNRCCLLCYMRASYRLHLPLLLHFHKLSFLTSVCSIEAGAVCTELEGPFAHTVIVASAHSSGSRKEGVVFDVFEPAPPPRATVLIPRLCWLLSPVLPRQAANGSRWNVCFVWAEHPPASPLFAAFPFVSREVFTHPHAICLIAIPQRGCGEIERNCSATCGGSRFLRFCNWVGFWESVLLPITCQGAPLPLQKDLLLK